MLTASHLYQYTACPRWSWNELHGDPKRKRGPSAFLKKLFADGIQHEESIYAALQPARVPYVSDRSIGEAETARLMAAGAPLIAQAVLRDPDGRTGIVDLLERLPGKSALGEFTYEPVEIKTARGIKPVYKLQLAFYGDLLARVLGTWPARAHVILHDGARTSFDLAEVRTLYESLLAGLRSVVAGVEPPVHISSTCGDCPWELTCLLHAETIRDVSLTYGMQRRTAQELRRRGIATLPGLAELDPLEVAQWTGLAPSTARQLVTQARALEDGNAVWHGQADFESATEDLYFDIEGDPEHDVLYLFGVLVRGRDGSESYRAFVAEQPEDEERAFNDLLTFLEAHPGVPVYHYHHYERAAMRQLGTRHHVESGRIAQVLMRLRDLHRDLSTSVVLPVYSYSLKAVAKHLGHAWRHPDASAAQSMYWYSSWLKTGDRQHLDDAVEYNEDDCRATRILKEWLAAGPEAVATAVAAVPAGAPRGPVHGT